jgi:hypothetical protein
MLLILAAVLFVVAGYCVGRYHQKVIARRLYEKNQELLIESVAGVTRMKHETIEHLRQRCIDMIEFPSRNRENILCGLNEKAVEQRVFDTFSEKR